MDISNGHAVWHGHTALSLTFSFDMDTQQEHVDMFDVGMERKIDSEMKLNIGSENK
jgi:hypothetical protein